MHKRKFGKQMKPILFDIIYHKNVPIAKQKGLPLWQIIKMYELGKRADWS